MASFREALLRRMQEMNYGEEALARQAISVFKGEKVTKKFKLINGEMREVERVVTVDPKDAGLGLALVDNIVGNEMGMTRKSLSETRPHDRMFEVFAPVRDPRIVIQDSALPSPQPEALSAPTSSVEEGESSPKDDVW